MARADKPKQAMGRTREPQEQDRSPLAGSADDARPTDGASGYMVSTPGQRATRRWARSVPRPASPRGRVAH